VPTAETRPAKPTAVGDVQPDAPVALRVRGVTKRYGGVAVVDDVDLALRAGSVHALLGENGAGKSTLIKILSGVVQADAGTVERHGRPVRIASPRDAVHHGIATLHQELSIVPGLSVAENIFLGKPLPRRAGTVRFRELDRRARALLETLGQDLDVGADAARLSPVGMTMTAIARALSSEAEVVVLDEPTAALTDAETRQLFGVVERLTAQGVAVLYVSHRLDEVFAVADEHTVLRNGRKVAEGPISGTSAEAVIAAMVGRSLDALFPPAPTGVDPSVAPALELRGVGGRRTHGVDLVVRPGEVVGLAGLAGSGRSEIVRIVAGAQRAREGSMALRGAPYRPRSVGAAQRAGVGFVPQERRTDGLVPDSIEHNVNLTTLGRYAMGGVLTSRRRSRAHASAAADRIGVRRRDIGQDVLTLSGGNQQKVVLAKALAREPSLLLLDEPTRGVDVGTKSEIYHLVRDRVAQGAAAIVVSSELPELLGLCDRILVMHEGRPAGWFDAAAATEHDLLLACYGRSA